MWKMDPMSGFDIRLLFTIPPRENWFQYVYAEYTQLQLISLHYNLTPTYKRYEVNHL